MGKSSISTGPLGVWWCMIYSPVVAGGGSVAHGDHHFCNMWPRNHGLDTVPSPSKTKNM